MSQYLITDKDGNGHLPVRKSADGPLDHGLMGAAHAALTKGYRGNRYEGPGKEEALAKLKNLYKSEGMDWPGETAASSVARVSSPAPRSAGKNAGEDTRATAASRVFCAVEIDWAAGAPPEGIAASHDGVLRTHAICTTGTWVHPRTGQEMTLSAADLETMAANFAKDARGEVNCDYEHASEMPTVAAGGPVPASGWIKRLWVEAGGRLMAAIEWTAAAAGMIERREYKYVSPAVGKDADLHTGAAQGMTLSSVALTNTPVMRELPALSYSTVAGARVLEAPNFRASGQGGTMEHLTLKKMTMAGHEGHHGVFDGDNQVGCVTDKHMADHFKACNMSADGGEMPAAMSAARPVLEECGLVFTMSGAALSQVGGLDDLRGLVLAGRAKLAADRAAEGHTLMMSCVADGKLDHTKLLATAKANGDKISLDSLIQFQRADSLFSAAFAKGLIAPMEKDVFFNLALTDPARFEKFAAEAVPRATLSAKGNPGAEAPPVDVQFDNGVRALMSAATAAGRKLTYGAAMMQFERENPEVAEAYRKAHSKQMADDQPAAK